MLKKLTMLCIVSLIFLLSVEVVYAGVDYDEEAKALNKMHLLSGDGIDFNLHSKLKRSEASAFIVKMKGVQNDVLKEKDKYASISEDFSDVSKDAWYAPYVGYCQRNGIISGFEDNTFRAEEYVTEKQFLAMLLNAMEYDGGRDYDWSTVLIKAYEIGISDNIEHAVSSEDNAQYYRKDVVHNIFLSLDKLLDDEGITVVENLINKNVTTEKIAESYDVLKRDEVKTKIHSINVEDKRTIKMIFNEEIEKPQMSQLEITSNNRGLEIDDISILNKALTIKLSQDLYGGPKYRVTLKTVTDLDGYESENLQMDFDGVEEEEVVSDDFKIKRVRLIDKNKAVIEFTHPITENAENVLYYRFGPKGKLLEGSFKNLEVRQLVGEKNSVLLEFEDLEFESGKDYEISVRGDLQSAYLAYMNRGDGDSNTFKGRNIDLEPMEVDDLEVVDSSFLKVEFNLPVDEESAFDRNNFRVRDLNTGGDQRPTKIYYFQDEDGIDATSLLLKFSALREDREYELMIDDVYDLYLTSYVDRFEDTFDGEDYEELPELDDVVVRDRNTLILEYDRPLSEDATSIDIDINHGVDVEEVAWFEEEPYLLYVYLEKGDYLDEDEDYELEIEDKVPDYLGVSSEKNEYERFPGTDEYMDELYISEVIEISPGVFKVKFNDYIDVEDAADIDNFTLSYKVNRKTKYNAPSEVIEVNSKTIVIQFDTYTIDEDLTLEVDEIRDPSKQYIYKELEYDLGRLEE